MQVAPPRDMNTKSQVSPYRSPRQMSEKGLWMACADSIAAVVALREDWLALEEAAATPLNWFQSYNYCQNWLTRHPDLYDKPAVLSLREDGELVAIWPLMRKSSHLGIRILCNLGEPHTQYGGIIACNGQLTDAQSARLFAAARSLGRVDSAIFNFIPERSPIAAMFSTNSELRQLRNESAYLDLTPYADAEAYLASRSREQRKNRGRKVKLLEKQGVLSFRAVSPQEPGFSDLARQCLAFKRVWLAKTGRAGQGLRRGRHEDFLAGLAPQDGNEGPVLFSLELDGKPIAIEIGFIYRRHYYSYIASFNYTYYEASPGKVLMEKAICWLIERGATSYDLLANPTEYKHSWTDRQIALQSHRADYTLRGALYSRGWAAILRPQFKKLFEAMPLRFRTGLLMLRTMSSANLD